MFGMHKRYGREAGAHLRIMIAQSASNTYFTDLLDFTPPKELFHDNYFIGFWESMIHIKRVAEYGGSNWSTPKKVDYFSAAVLAFQNGSNVISPIDFMTLITSARGSSDYIIGCDHAELNASAIYKKLPQSSTSPLVAEARKAATFHQGLLQKTGILELSSDPDAGFQVALMDLSVGSELSKRFPKKDP